MRSKNILKVILEGLNIPFTNSYADALYNEHPHDSMFAISRLLNMYKIPNEGLMIEDKNEMFNIEPPYIAQFASDLVVIERYTGENVQVNKSGDRLSVPNGQFKEESSGAVLLYELAESSGESGYKDNHYKELFSKFSRIILQAGILLLIIIWSLFSGVFNSAGRAIYLLASLWGAFISNLLLVKEIGQESTLADNFCSILGDKGDCGSVIESEGSKLFGIIGWAEIGLGFFVSNTIMAVFEFDLVLLMVMINGVSLLFIPWSVWYQKTKVGKWCPLCLMVLLLLMLLFIIGLSFSQLSIPKLSIVRAFELALVYLCPLIAISLIVTVLSEKKRLSDLVRRNVDTKFYDDVFKTRLISQPHYDIDPDVSRIVFGNTEAKNLVSIISNPHCGPCAQIHNKLDRLIEYKSDVLCIQFLFLNFNDESKRNSGRFLIAAYLQEGKDKARSIFENWFTEERETVAQTYKKYGFNIESEEVISEQNKHAEWCAAHGINGTPTILINGYVLPPDYNLDDLLFLF